GARDGVEPGRVDDDVELVFLPVGLNATFRHTLDRRLVDIDELDVGLIEDFVVAVLERRPARAETVVLRDEPFGDNRIVHTLTNLLRDKFARKRVGGAVGQEVAEIALPEPETG